MSPALATRAAFAAPVNQRAFAKLPDRRCTRESGGPPPPSSAPLVSPSRRDVGERSTTRRCSFSRGLCCRAAAAPSTTSGSTEAAEPGPSPHPAAVLAVAAKTQLLCCQLNSSSDSSSSSSGGNGGIRTLYLEVARSRQGRVEAVCDGELLQLSISSDGQLSATPAGFLPRLGDPWLKRVPGLADSLKRIRQQQADDGTLPSQLIAAHGVSALHPVQTLAQFCARVAAAPGAWCDGAGPEDPPLTEDEQALLTAGELAAFLAGSRGVCLLQLHKGWGDRSTALQPLLRPWVLPLLQQAGEHKGVVLLGSSAPGAPELGASLVLCARQQPFHAWGKHLAGQGVQSSIVADSPFYKLLIGRILGYRPQNIYHHIESMGGRMSGEVVEAVDAELAALSPVPPSLPWTGGSGGQRR